MATLFFWICVLLLMSIRGTNGKYWFPKNPSCSKLGIYSGAAVATDAAPCASVGRQILELKGSAVDSALAMLICMGAVNPVSQGLGGGFMMVIYDKKKKRSYSLDARETAPLAACKDMFRSNRTASILGGLAIAVPGELAGYALAHRKFGKLPWSYLFIPTIRLCLQGIPVSQYLAEKLKLYSGEIQKRPLFRRLFTNKRTGRLFIEGDVMHRPDLARTLHIISNDGPCALYDPRHPLAAAFQRDLKNMGSIITARDMMTYRPRLRFPISADLNNNGILYSSQIPGSGALLAYMVNVLQGYNITRRAVRCKRRSVLTMHRMIETFKFAYAQRMYLEDDFYHLQPRLSNLISKRFADRTRGKINDRTTHHNISYYNLPIGNIEAEDHGTSHASVVALNGDAVSVTSTINYYFGSFEISQSTGILLNNEMDNFSKPPFPHNNVVPGRRPFSSMVPTIVVDRNGNVRLALGGNGGKKITTAVLLVLLRNLWLGDDIKTAIDGARFHHQLFPNKLMFEKNFPLELKTALEKRGHRIDHTKHDTLGIIMGIARMPDGRLSANADYRKMGGVDGLGF